MQAPLILVVCVIPEKAWRNKEGKDLSAVDAAIVMDHIVLAATDLGAGHLLGGRIRSQCSAQDIPNPRRRGPGGDDPARLSGRPGREQGAQTAGPAYPFRALAGEIRTCPKI